MKKPAIDINNRNVPLALIASWIIITLLKHGITDPYTLVSGFVILLVIWHISQK